MTPIADRRRLTWDEAYNKFVLSLIAIVLTLIGVISGFVGFQLKELTAKVQTLSEKMAEESANQRGGMATDAMLQKQIDDLKLEQTQILSYITRNK
jgi:cell division protein FtsB